MVFRGNEHDFLFHGKDGNVELITSEDVIDEVKRVIRIKFPEYIDQVDIFIKSAGIKIIERKIYQKNIDKYNIVRDKKDRHLLAAAYKQCDILVSGDKDLLVLEEYKGIKIVRTRKILNMLNI